MKKKKKEKMWKRFEMWRKRREVQILFFILYTERRYRNFFSRFFVHFESRMKWVREILRDFCMTWFLIFLLILHFGLGWTLLHFLRSSFGIIFFFFSSSFFPFFNFYFIFPLVFWFYQNSFSTTVQEIKVCLSIVLFFFSTASKVNFVSYSIFKKKKITLLQ